jgi:tRNA pseudouridine55 synthase
MTDYQAGKTVVVDKPFGWTSFDVVNKIRWNLKQKLGVKNIKVGHAGTLDPLATGLLILCIGKDTKKIDQYMPGLKTYTGTILLGKTTPSYDLETEFDEVFETKHIDSDSLNKTKLALTGVIHQKPPVFSAKQIDGKRAYEFARAGKEVEMKTVEVEIHQFSIDDSRFPEIDFEITCSKGTYIRSIAYDFGKLLNSGGTLIALRRIKSGAFSIENALSPEEIIHRIQAEIAL